MQDFANCRNTTYLGASRPDAVDWSPDIPSVMMGVVVGVFVAIMGFKVVEYREAQSDAIVAPVVERAEDTPLKLEFYEALKVYEVLPRDKEI